MNTTEKTLLGTAAFAAGSAVGTFFAGRAAWRGINKARPIGVIVLAILAYHTFDSYRVSVDTAWSKLETVIEKRAEAETAEQRAKTAEAAKAQLEKEAAAKTAAFNAQKATDMERAEKAYQASLKDAAESEVKRLTAVYAHTLYVTGASSINTKAAEKEFDKAIDTWMAFPHSAAERSKLLDDLGVIFMETKRNAQKLIEKPKQATAKPVAKPKPVAEPVARPAVPAQTVEQAQAAYDKATAIYNELCPHGCWSGTPYTQWKNARDNLASVKMAN